MTALAQSLPRPRTRSARLAADVALVVGGSLAIAALAQFSIALPFTPVPITGQTLGVLLVGASFGWLRGGASVGLYLAQGSVLGLPFFAEGRSGVELLYLSSPTGGYLWGFVLAALLVGWLANRGWDRSIGSSVAAMFLGNLVIYSCGLPWLMYAVGVPFGQGLQMGVLPFVMGDVVKILIAAGSLPLAWRLVDRRFDLGV